MNADRNLITEHWQEDTALERFRMIFSGICWIKPIKQCLAV